VFLAGLLAAACSAGPGGATPTPPDAARELYPGFEVNRDYKRRE